MIIDCGVYPVLDNKELSPLVGEPWKRRLPPLFGSQATPPFPFLTDEVDRAADPAVAITWMNEHAIDLAILTPLTRGLLPHPVNTVKIVQVTNQWLHDRWLEAPGTAGRFAASIRVPIALTTEAVEEIERWSGDPRFVQVAVAMRTPAPFGDERYFPIWEAAASRGLPIFVRDDGPRANLEWPATPSGAPVHFAEYYALAPFANMVHISSLITSGVFDRIPNLRFVFADGGLDLAYPMLWRVDKDWRAGRFEVPWVTEAPDTYLRKHVRFVSQPEDGRTDGHRLEAEQLRVTEAADLLLFGSHYPYWDQVDPVTNLGDWPEPARTNVLAENARRLYSRLPAATAAR